MVPSGVVVSHGLPQAKKVQDHYNEEASRREIQFVHQLKKDLDLQENLKNIFKKRQLKSNQVLRSRPVQSSSNSLLCASKSKIHLEKFLDKTLIGKINS